MRLAITAAVISATASAQFKALEVASVQPTAPVKIAAGKSVEIPISIRIRRGYHINSDKIKRVLGYEPKRTVEDAIRDLCIKFKQGMFKDSLSNPIYTNVKHYVDNYGLGKKIA